LFIEPGLLALGFSEESATAGAGGKWRVPSTGLKRSALASSPAFQKDSSIGRTTRYDM
jgi:hypothetical protein